MLKGVKCEVFGGNCLRVEQDISDSYKKPHCLLLPLICTNTSEWENTRHIEQAREHFTKKCLYFTTLKSNLKHKDWFFLNINLFFLHKNGGVCTLCLHCKLCPASRGSRRLAFLLHMSHVTDSLWVCFQFRTVQKTRKRRRWRHKKGGGKKRKRKRKQMHTVKTVAALWRSCTLSRRGKNKTEHKKKKIIEQKITNKLTELCFNAVYTKQLFLIKKKQKTKQLRIWNRFLWQILWPRFEMI